MADTNKETLVSEEHTENVTMVSSDTHEKHECEEGTCEQVDGEQVDGEQVDGGQVDGEQVKCCEQKASIVDESTIHEHHKDPFVVKEDKCSRPECTKPMDERIPCLSCFGMSGYCSMECMWDDYHEHNYECMIAQRRAFNGVKTIPALRQKQINSGGFRKLIEKVIKEVDRQTLFESLLFVRLPLDARAKIKADHPIKKIPRLECVRVLSKNLCFREVFKRWIRHVRVAADMENVKYLYFFAYAPDCSFAYMIAIPVETQQKFDSSLEPVHTYIACPCTMHSGDVIAPKKPNPM